MKQKNNQNRNNIIRSSAAEYLTYIASTGDNASSIEIRYENENIWLTQKMMAELYGVDTRTINEHILKIFRDSELREEATIRKFRIVQKEGNRSVARNVFLAVSRNIIGRRLGNKNASIFASLGSYDDRTTFSSHLEYARNKK